MGTDREFDGGPDHALGPPAAQWRRVAGHLAAVANAVPAERWDAPSPCAGWTARAVVRHMVEWMPGFLAGVGITIPAVPDPDADPATAWSALADHIQALLDDPAIAEREFRHEHLGASTVGQAVATIMVGDVVIHTWDIARATGGDERLPADLVHSMLAEMEPLADALVASGHYGPRVPVHDEDDEQTRLLALTGRRA